MVVSTHLYSFHPWGFMMLQLDDGFVSGRPHLRWWVWMSSEHPGFPPWGVCSLSWVSGESNISLACHTCQTAVHLLNLFFLNLYISLFVFKNMFWWLGFHSNSGLNVEPRSRKAPDASSNGWMECWCVFFSKWATFKTLIGCYNIGGYTTQLYRDCKKPLY